MRIIAGRLGSRIFDSPGTHKTHPMSDRVRGALFNSLGDVTGLTVLDAFGGTGALSFEAVSRGAKSATAIDNDRQAQKTISTNILALGLKTSVKLINAGAGAWLTTSDDKFDIVLLDPPYDKVQLSLLNQLADRAKSTIVISLPPKVMPELDATKFSLRNQKSYGDAILYFFDVISR